MTNVRGRYQGNTIILEEPLDLREGQQVVVRVEPVPEERREGAKPGLLKGKIHMSEDFDAPLEDFKDYM